MWRGCVLIGHRPHVKRRGSYVRHGRFPMRLQTLSGRASRIGGIRDCTAMFRHRRVPSSRQVDDAGLWSERHANACRGKPTR
jgi:hypothetical protein